MEVASTDLEVRTTVAPARVTLGAVRNVVRLTVSVTNPFDRAVTVDVGGPPYEWGHDLRESTGVAFGYRIHARDGGEGGPGAVTFGRPVFEFDAGETLEETFEIVIGGDGGWEARPVPYDVLGSFGRQRGAPATLRAALPIPGAAR